MIMIIDFGVLGYGRRALHDPDGVVVVPIMNNVATLKIK